MADLAAITHDGKVIVVGSGQDGVLRYTVRQSGFENSALVPSDSTGLPGFEAWKTVPLNRSTFDASVAAFERNNLVDNDGRPILRSVYGRAGAFSSVGRVKLLSGLDHLYLFRIEPESRRLLMNRFVLDGMANELVPKLEVRYTRSGQKLAPEGGISGAGAVHLDTLAYRDTAQRPFFEPAQELSFLGRFDLDEPWFSVELIPTGEHGKHRWCFFVLTSEDDGPTAVRLFSVAASAEGLIDPFDQRRVQQDPDKADRKVTTTISGIVERSLLLPGPVVAGFDSTLYNNQVSRATKSGEQLLKDSTRVMLAVPVKLESDTMPSITTLSFTVSNLGLLAQIDRRGETEVLSGKPKEILLPPTDLDGIKLIADRTPPPAGDISRIGETADGTISLTSTEEVTERTGISPGREVRVWGTRSHDGMYVARSVDEEAGTFELEQAVTSDESTQGHWEVVDDGRGLTFDNMIAAYEPASAGRLKITCTSLSLSEGDEVRIEGTQSHDGLYPVTAVNPDDNSFVIDSAWPAGEVVNLSVRNRRGLSFDGHGDHLRVEEVEVSGLRESGPVERTFRAWVQTHSRRGETQTLFSCESKLLKVDIDETGRLVTETHFADGHVESLTDPEALVPGTWEHVAVTLAYDGDGLGTTELSILRGGAEVAQVTVPQRKPLLLPLKNLHLDNEALPISTSFELDKPSRELTIEAWVKPAGDDRGVIASWQHDGAYELAVSGPADARVIEWATNDSTLITDALLSEDRWHHVAATFDPASGESSIVIDGEVANRETSDGVAFDRLLTPADAAAVQRPYVLGALGAPIHEVPPTASTAVLFTHDDGAWKQIGPRSWVELNDKGEQVGPPFEELQRTDDTIALRSEYSVAPAGLPDVVIDVGTESQQATRWNEERAVAEWHTNPNERTSAEVEGFDWISTDDSGAVIRERFERTSPSEWQLVRDRSIEYYTEYHRTGDRLWLKFDHVIDQATTIDTISDALDDAADAVGSFFGGLLRSSADFPRVSANARSERSALRDAWAQVDFSRQAFMLRDIETGNLEEVRYSDQAALTPATVSQVQTDFGMFELRTPHLRQWSEVDKNGQIVGNPYSEVLRTSSTIELRQPGADSRVIFDTAASAWTRVHERVPTTIAGTAHALNPAPSSTDRYQGGLAEVRIWQQVRSADQIDATRSVPLDGSEDELVAYWPLGETGSEEATDLTKNKLHLDLTELRASGSLPAIRDVTAAAQRLDGDPLPGRGDVAQAVGLLAASHPAPLLVVDPGLETTTGSVTEAVDGATLALSLAWRLARQDGGDSPTGRRFILFDVAAAQARAGGEDDVAEVALAQLTQLGAEADDPVVVISDFGLLVHVTPKMQLAKAMKQLTVVGLATSTRHDQHIQPEGWWRHFFDVVEIIEPIPATEIPAASAWSPTPHRAPGPVAGYAGTSWSETYLIGADLAPDAPDAPDSDGTNSVSHFAGKLSEVELWTTNPSAEHLRQQGYLQLQGNEFGLEHYWRCGGILADPLAGSAARFTPDLGPGGRDAVLVGDIFVSARDLPRRDGAGLAVRFTNDDLVAVSQGGTYQETFEFRATSADGTHWTLHDLRNADGNGSDIFSLRYWGKRSRTSDDIVDIPTAAVQQDDIVDLGDGWFRASARLTIPNDVNMLRCFELDQLRGLSTGDDVDPDDWAMLSLRRHRIELVSNVVSRTTYLDDITRLERADDNSPALRQTIAELPALERGAARKHDEIGDIVERLKALELKAQLAPQVGETQSALDRARRRLDRERQALHRFETVIFNHVLRLANLGTGAVIGIDNANPILVGTEAQAAQVIIERRGQGECHVRIAGRYLAVRDRDDTIAHSEDTRALGFLWKTGEREWTEPITHENEIYLANTGVPEATWRLVERGNEEVELRNTAHHVSLASRPAISAGVWSQPPSLIGLAYQPAHELSQWKLSRFGTYRPDGYETDLRLKQDKVARAFDQQRRLEDRLAWLNDVLSMTAADAQALRDRRDRLQTEMNGLQSRIGDINNSFLALRDTAGASTMHPVSEDATGLATYGLQLALASPATSVTVDATAEGNVQLSYFDSTGRLQFTNYDATSDSANGYFEEWLGTGTPVCVELVDDAAKISVDPIELPRSGNTIEAWFYYPIPAGRSLPGRLAFLTSDATGSEAAIAVSSGRRLGTVVDGFFHDAGIDLEARLDQGWHHVAATTQGTASAFYLDGEPVAVGTSPAARPARFAREFGSVGSAVGRAEAADFAITGDFSFQAWVRVDAAATGGRGHLFRVLQGAGLGWDSDGTTAAIWFADFARASAMLVADLSNGFSGDWVNIAVSVSNNIAVLYIDGVAVKRGEFGGGFGTGRFEIGRSTPHTQNDASAPPLISDAQLWNRALSADEVFEHMYVAPEPQAEGLVGHWPMSLVEVDGVPALRNVHEPEDDQKPLHLRLGISVPTDRLERMTRQLTAAVTKPVTTLGNRPTGGTPAGRVGHFRFWSTVLSDEEIRVNALIGATGNEPDLVACFPLEELGANSSEAPNLTGGKPARLERARVVARSAAIGNPGANVAVFDARRLGERRTAISIPMVDLRTSVTIEFWVKRSGGALETFVSSGSIELAPMFEVKVDHEELTVVFGESSLTAELDGTGIDRWMHVAIAHDHEAQTLSLFADGSHLRSVGGIPSLDSESALTLGVGTGALSGQMAEFRVWSVARSELQVAAAFRSRASGSEEGLALALPLDERFSLEPVVNLVAGSGDATTPHGIPGSVRSDDLPMVPGRSLITAEYSTVGAHPDGAGRRAMLRRFFGFIGSTGRPTLLPGKRVEELVLKWIGNAQFEPTLLGFIEGAPPVPSENLTIDTDYDGGTSVELVSSDEVEYSWNRSTDMGRGLDINAFLGVGWQVDAGIGISAKVTEGHLGLRGSASTEWRREASSNIRASSTQTSRDELELRGSFEIDPKFPHLGPRYVPKNVGYALVVSGMADVFITQMKRTGRMVAYEVQPARDMPPDVNTITFLLNPAYTLNGSLDGLVGSHAADDRLYRHVPEMRAQHGSRYPASYYNLSEAYDLKSKIEKLDVGREAYFAAFESEAVMGLGDDLLADIPPAEDDLDSSVGGSLGDESLNDPAEGDTRSERERSRDEKKRLERQFEQRKKDSEADSEKRVDAIKTRFGDSEKQHEADAAFKAWQRKMEGLQVGASKRNIQNTYVWDADGGIRYEEESFATTIEHTIGGSFNLNATLGADLNFQYKWVKAELQAMATLAMSQTMTKSRSSTRSFELNVRMDRVERRGVTDAEDYPIQPGEKVDRYRFMSFYLEGDTDHFHDFFREVVDPEWLMSNDEEARALRQVARGRPNKAWRVLHRVTYVERPALMGFGRDLRVSNDLEEAAEEVYNYFDALEEDNDELRKQVSALSGEIKKLGAKFDAAIGANAGRSASDHEPSGSTDVKVAGEDVIDLSEASPQTGLDRLNEADADELEALVGVGPALALAIINHRRANGRFESVGELVEISGIGSFMMDQLRSQLDEQSNA